MINKVREIASWFYKSLFKKKQLIPKNSLEKIPNLHKVFIKDIRFVESNNHSTKNSIKITTIDGQEFYKMMSLTSFLNQFDTFFVRCSKFELLNLMHIDKRYEYLYCWSGKYQFTISRKYRQSFIQKIEEYYS